jgi:hypothetical protein
MCAVCSVLVSVSMPMSVSLPHNHPHPLSCTPFNNDPASIYLDGVPTSAQGAGGDGVSVQQPPTARCDRLLDGGGGIYLHSATLPTLSRHAEGVQCTLE